MLHEIGKEGWYASCDRCMRRTEMLRGGASRLLDLGWIEATSVGTAGCWWCPICKDKDSNGCSVKPPIPRDGDDPPTIRAEGFVIGVKGNVFRIFFVGANGHDRMADWTCPPGRISEFQFGKSLLLVRVALERDEVVDVEAH